jgi:cold shock CspA family protein
MGGEMSATGTVTNIPLQITFHHAKATTDAEERIRAEVGKLSRFYRRIMGCRVVVEGSSGRREGNPYLVRVDLTVPGGELVVRNEPSLAGSARQIEKPEIRKGMESRRSQKGLRVAIHDAFKSAGRRLEDYARRQRLDTKQLVPAPAARVTQIFPDKGYGFLITKEGREVYFHKDSVLNQAFDRLRVGSAVTFAEEAGDKGPQASSVKIAARQGARPRAHKPAA